MRAMRRCSTGAHTLDSKSHNVRCTWCLKDELSLVRVQTEQAQLQEQLEVAKQRAAREQQRCDEMDAMLGMLLAQGLPKTVVASPRQQGSATLKDTVKQLFKA
jgi:hypothetical protein